MIHAHMVYRLSLTSCAFTLTFISEFRCCLQAIGAIKTLKMEWGPRFMRLQQNCQKEGQTRWFSIMWSQQFYEMCNMNPSMRQAINMALVMMLEDEHLHN